MKSVVVALIIAVCLYAYGHHKGWAERDLEMQAEIASKNEESRAREQKLSEQLYSTSSQLKEANDAITEKQSSLDRAIRAGRVRLPSSGCVQTSASAPAAAGDSQDASESDRQTLLLIAQLAAEGDQAINRLNACIAAYNAAREQVNDQR